jgi:WD40 repeat protein
VALGGLIAGGVAVMADGGPADPAPPMAANGATPVRPAADPPPAVERNEDLWVWQERIRPTGDGILVRSVAFTPDGKALVAGRTDGMVNWWPADRNPPRYTWAAAGAWTAGKFAAVAVAPSGATVAVAHRDGVQLLEAATGKPTDAITVGRSDPAAVAFSPDGKRVAFTNGLTLWTRDLPRLTGGGADFGPLANAVKNGAVAAVAWAPDGKRVAFLPNMKIDPTWPGNGDSNPNPAKATHWYAQIWGAGSGEAMTMLKHGTAQLTALAWSADGSTIATADADGGIVLWDGTTFVEKRRLTAPGGVTCLALRADGKRLAVGVTGAKPKDPKDPATAPQVVVYTEWEPAKNWLESSTMGGPPGETIRGVAFSPDGKVLAAAAEGPGGQGGGLRVWDRVFVRAAEK